MYYSPSNGPTVLYVLVVLQLWVYFDFVGGLMLLLFFGWIFFLSLRKNCVDLRVVYLGNVGNFYLRSALSFLIWFSYDRMERRSQGVPYLCLLMHIFPTRIR